MVWWTQLTYQLLCMDLLLLIYVPHSHPLFLHPPSTRCCLRRCGASRHHRALPAKGVVAYSTAHLHGCSGNPEKSSSRNAGPPSWRHHRWSFADYQTCGCSSIAPLVHLPVLRLSSSSRKCTAQFIVRLGSLFHLLGGSSLSFRIWYHRLIIDFGSLFDVLSLLTLRFRSQPSMEGGKSRNGVNHGKGKGGTISFPRRSLCGRQPVVESPCTGEQQGVDGNTIISENGAAFININMAMLEDGA
ncbi:uncharacterized protein LOC123413097 isoform X2 [Hordeum vulgare subsp. vulgare]|uniref:uncharacterized protein LOC123413097 isoform X2 n=1 Tax=Hordeum vulgare subsp. vulgare TaxID=112509 RepID=UPI00162C29D8|nr:uncharacterized protein LOC123413097 isoform X2 [Hordeum vulgare subsp. vulgare]